MRAFSNRPSPASASFLALVFLVLFASCVPGAKAPQVTPLRTLDLEGEGGGKASAAPFGIVFASPKGPTDDPSEITVVFNRPMRALDLAGEEAKVPVTVAAKGQALKGAWRWMGTSAAIFAPSEHLPRATEYTVTVPAGTRAMGGSVLATAYSFAFSTPPPRLERTAPGDGHQHLKPTQTIELRFNQPVEPQEVERAVKLVVGEGKGVRTLGVKASRPSDDTPMRVAITPVAPLPLDTPVRLTVAGSLRGTEGPLTVGKDQVLSMRTYGPMKVRQLDCYRDTPNKKCASRSSVYLALSNRASYREWKSHVRIEPQTKVVWSAVDDDTMLSSGHGLWAKLRAATSYRVIITRGMKDEFGQVLARDVVLPFETDDEWPEIEVGVEGQVFEASSKGKARSVPIGSINVGSFSLLTATPSEAEVARLLAARDAGSAKETAFARLKRQVPSAKVESVQPEAPNNVQWIKRIELDDALASKKGKGTLAFAVSAPGLRNLPDHRMHLVQVTDLAVSAKMSRFGSVVWVTKLSDGKPASGATVAVRDGQGKELFNAKCDASGLVEIPAVRYSPVNADGRIDDKAIVVARLGDDWSHRRVVDMLDTWRYQPSSDPFGALVPMGMVFTDRGIYKAGETVRVKGLFRLPTARGTETPAGRDVTLEAFDVNDERVFEKTLRLGAFGEFSADVPVAAAAKLGSMQLRAALVPPGGKSEELGPRSPYREGVASASVQIAAYRAAEFKVTVDPDRTSYVRGDRAGFVTRGDYLFGAPMTQGAVRYSVTRSTGYFTPPGAEDFVLRDWAYKYDGVDANPSGGEMASGSGTLGARGDFSHALTLTMPNQSGTEVLSFESEVEDVSRQTIAGRASVLVHPAEFYVAMKRPKDWFLPQGSTLKVELAAFEPEGKRRPGVKIGVELVRRTWHSVAANAGESLHYESKVVDKVTSTCSATSLPAGLAACNLTLAEPGYYIVRASGVDGRKNPTSASSSIYVLPKSEGGAAEAVGWRMDDGSKLDIVADKESYEIGDTATLLIKNPFREAEALITVERAGVYRRERRVLTGPMPTLKIPITEEMRPNAFVSVHLVHGRTKDAPAAKALTPGEIAKLRSEADVGKPAFRLGYHELSINPEARRLDVTVTPSQREYRPGQEVECDVRVTDRQGKPVRSDVTFYAVDEGVLMLTGYKTPDPIPVFSAPRPLSVFSLETRDDLARVLLSSLGNGSLDKGFEGGGGGEVRADFRATAAFMPKIVAEGGKARVRFKLPDNLTTYRLMAVVAAEDDRFGFTDTQIVASRKLMARPALPRFLRAGDAIEAGVVLSSKGMPAANVEVTAAVTGAELQGDAKRVVALPANGSVEVRFGIRSPRAGKAKLSFRAKAGGESDAVEITRDVAVPLVMEAVALAGETEGAVGERLGDLSAMRDDVGGLDVRLASTALVGLDNGVEQLLEYPYGCTEQLVSRLVPLVEMRDLAKDYGIKLPKNIDAVTGDTLRKIVRNQQEDGSFGFWNDSPRGHAWITAYAAWGLGRAKKHGHYVPEGVLPAAIQSLRGQLRTSLDLALNRASAAFALDVLAEAGEPDPGFMNELFAVRDKLPLFARALLAHAMILSKMEGADELLRDVDNHLRVTPTGATVAANTGDEYAVLLDSEARTTALVLRALLAKEKNHPLGARLARGLLGMRHGGTWRTTQETAWSLIALDDYRRAQEAKPPAFDARVFLGDAEIYKAAFQGRSVQSQSASYAASKLFASGAGGGVLAFQVQGKGKLFYEARLRYAKRELPQSGLDRGFFVRKIVRRVKPEELSEALKTVPDASVAAVSAGDLVLVDLYVITTSPRENVVVDDPLPAGLEPIQNDLSTASRSLAIVDRDDDNAYEDEDEYDDARASGRAVNVTSYHREYHDDRVLTFVEHMPAGLAHYRYLARATTHGRFVVPPARAECMYEPETFGRTGATTFEVKAR